MIIWSLNHAISSIVWEINILLFGKHNKELLQADFNQQSSYIEDFLSDNDARTPKHIIRSAAGTVERGLPEVDAFELFTNIDFYLVYGSQQGKPQSIVHNHKVRKHLHGCLFNDMFVVVLLKNLDKTCPLTDSKKPSRRAIMAINIPGVIVMVFFYLLVLTTGMWAFLKSKRKQKKSAATGMEMTLLGN